MLGAGVSAKTGRGRRGGAPRAGASRANAPNGRPRRSLRWCAFLTNASASASSTGTAGCAARRSALNCACAARQHGNSRGRGGDGRSRRAPAPCTAAAGARSSPCPSSCPAASRRAGARARRRGRRRMRGACRAARGTRRWATRRARRRAGRAALARPTAPVAAVSNACIEGRRGTHALLGPQPHGLRLGLFKVLLVELLLPRDDCGLERLLLCVRLWQRAVVLCAYISSDEGGVGMGAPQRATCRPP